MGNLLISWLLVLGLVLQQGPSFALAKPAKPSTQNTDQNVTILPDLPFVENYSAEVFQSHNQIFSVAEDQRGVMLFGNGEGWLEFDGTRFRHTKTKSPVVSIAVDHHGVLHIGLIKDFGRLLPNDRGKLVFESLNTGSNENLPQIATPINIHTSNQEMYFNTANGQAYRLAHEQLEKINLDVGPRLSKVGDYIFSYNDSGIYIINGTKPVVLPQTQSLCKKNEIVVVFPYSPQQLLILNQNQGFFLYSFKSRQGDGTIDLDHLQEHTGQRVQVFETSVADYIKQHLLVNGIRLANGDYALGTWDSGVVIMGSDGRLLQIINENSGLIDNYVRSLYQDRTGNLWLPTNNGISYVELSSPLSQFEDGEQTGFTLKAIRYRNRLFVGGFKGAFYHSGYETIDGQPKPKMVLIKGSTPYCWDMLIHQDRLLIGLLTGLLALEGTKVVDQVKTKKPVMSFGTSARFPRHVFVGFQRGFSALTLEKTANGGTQIRLLDQQQGDFAKIKGMIRKIVSDSEGNLWLTDLNGQILYIKFKSDQVSDFDVYAYDKRHGLPETSYNMVHFIDNRLIVGTRSGIYTKTDSNFSKTDPAQYTFALENTFGRKPNQANLRVHQIHKDQTGKIWISSYTSVSTLTPRPDGSYQWNRMRYKKIKGNVESMFFDENDVVWFSNTKGLYRYDQKKKPKTALDFRALINRVSVQNGPELFQGMHCQTEVQPGDTCKIPAISQSQTTIIDLPYENNSLNFEFGCTSYERPKFNRYSYKLEGYDKKWSDWTERSLKEYTSLTEGAYRFRVKARNIYEHLGKEASYAFRIQPPWHRTLWAYAAYFVLAMGLLAMGFRMYAWRLLAAKRRLERIVKERTAEVVRQKDEIQKAQKSALQHAHKAGMADIAINTIHKVGNLLNSAKVSMSLLFKYNINSSVTGCMKANELLQQNLHNLENFLCHDPKGKKLIEYYIKLGHSWQEENKHSREHLNTIAKQIDLISNAIAAQGRYADGAHTVESETRLEEIIQDALTIEAESIKSKAIQVKTNFDTIPMVKIQHIKLIQVLVNLIKNSVEAMENNTTERILTISLAHANQEILLKIEDNGEGITEIDINRIFNQGFSTRSEKRGYGLHDSANFITEIGGKLTGWSEGPGKGACFEVRLPYSKTNDLKDQV